MKDIPDTPKTENSNLHGFEVHRPSSKGTKLLLQVIKAIINQWIDILSFLLPIGIFLKWFVGFQYD